MTLFVVIMMLAAVSFCQGIDSIVRDDFETPTADGTFKWALQTEGGIYHEQQGSSGEHGQLIQGQYQYTAPDGQVINVIYKADENGFRAEGAHIPTPPPIPPAIQRALDYLATQPPSLDYNY